MPIPASMTVEWGVEGGERHKVEIPVRAKLVKTYPVNTIQVRFNGDQVEVYERFYESPSKRVDFKIYP